MGILVNLKSILREESWSHFTALGAPFYTNMYRAALSGYQDGYIPNIIMSIIVKLTNSVGYGINIYDSRVKRYVLT